MESLTTPEVINQPFANNGTRNTIPQTATGTNLASLQEGFPTITSTSVAEGGIPPARADFNALGYMTTYIGYFQQNGGNFTFSQDVSNAIGGYPKNACLWYFPSDDVPQIVVSNIANNTYNFNTDSSYIGEDAYWTRATVSGDGFVTIDTDQTITGAKTFSATPVLDSSAIPAAGDDSGNIVCSSWVNTAVASATPTGSIVAFAGSTAPDGFLICDGSAISRTTYSALFSVIGTTYGTGDGNTTFNLPTLSGIHQGTSFGVYGNGSGLGINDGSHSGVLIGNSTVQANIHSFAYTTLGTAIGTSSYGTRYNENVVMGVVTSGNSGLITYPIVISSNYIIKY